LQIAHSFVGKRVETTGGDIGFHLSIPPGGVELSEPFAKGRQLFGR
jgi:hypothetical protein